MKTLDLVLFAIAAVCFAAAAINVTHPRINLVALGLLAWLLIPAITLART